MLLIFTTMFGLCLASAIALAKQSPNLVTLYNILERTTSNGRVGGSAAATACSHVEGCGSRKINTFTNVFRNINEHR
ncbi:hypothetical protein PF005_g19888 [Phytophthora fragariae]|uniref:RxLR effector protein n=2 Tax=Phytophthora fragariae TaxID=53985 RepID=A0A6A3J109_9STRA|nr:hypothetical protein PF003_g20421 [Phytophthora fragariae]KAE8928853.1 hypothetical protein PF009_g21018 [Phytophthora fragariae]KAE8988999.1 hypothetical protein PF011_g18951 [Phytophthora fragariae]KAE9089005.1 hypothetical protein PF007_g19758 [Phytophthora fragariae]KAE9090122.1 hypothetical protein PF010_g18713 [Phytophthora fragariae]